MRGKYQDEYDYKVGWFKNLKENDSLEDLSTDERKISRWIGLQGGLIQKLEGKWQLRRPKHRREENINMNKITKWAD